MKNLLKTFAVVATLTLTPLMAAGEYVNNDILISAEDAMGLVGKKNVMFVSGDSDDVYKLGHIKGSVEMYAHHLHHSDITGEMHCAPLYRCIDDAEQYIGSKGIDNDTLVIAYDDFKGPNATGVYSFFQSYGHKNLKILNGGRNAMMQVDPAQAKYDAIKDELKAEKSNSKAAKKELKNAAQEKTKLSAKKKAELDKIISVSEKAQKALEAKLKAAEKDLIVVKGEEHVTPKSIK